LLKESNKENKEVQDFQKRVTKCQEELLQLSRTLKQVEEYNVQMRSEIAIKRRSTYKAEEEVIKLEKDKMDQDKLIDSLNEQVKKLSENGAILSTQMAAQQEETANAKQILKEAINEKERIETSKRSILEDWQNTLKDIQERDKNLAKLRDFNQEELMKILNVQSEIQGTQREILNEIQMSEHHDQKLSKCQDE
jgi:chromosome segregation ATPase